MERIQENVLAPREFSTATQDLKSNIQNHIELCHFYNPTFVKGVYSMTALV